MISNTKSSDSFDEAIKQLDISDIAFDDDGIINFYWPLDNKKSAEVMELITIELIPYVTDNEKKHSELVAVRILFKWFICEILRIFEATVLAEECKKDGIRPLIPKHYKKLDALYNSNSFECEFFLNQSSGPSYGRNIPRTLKRLGKEFLWNGFQIGLFRKYGSNQNDILAINPSSLAKKHAKGTNKLLRYSGYDEWFGSISKRNITKDSEDSAVHQNVLSIIKKSFREVGYVLSPESTKYISTWLNHANNFMNYYLNKDNHLLNKIHGDVWFGCTSPASTIDDFRISPGISTLYSISVWNKICKARVVTISAFAKEWSPA